MVFLLDQKMEHNVIEDNKILTNPVVGTNGTASDVSDRSHSVIMLLFYFMMDKIARIIKVQIRKHCINENHVKEVHIFRTPCHYSFFQTFVLLIINFGVQIMT